MTAATAAQAAVCTMHSTYCRMSQANPNTMAASQAAIGQDPFQQDTYISRTKWSPLSKNPGMVHQARQVYLIPAAGNQYNVSPATETVDISESTVVRVLSATRVPSTETITTSDSSLVRQISATRVPSADTITIADASLTRNKGYQGIPSSDSTTVSDSSLNRLLSATRLPPTDTTTVGETPSRLLSATRVPSSDTTTVADSSLTRSRGLPRVPSADTITTGDTSLTRLLSATRVPSADTITVTTGTATRMLSATRTPSSDTITIGDTSLTRLLSFVRLPATDTLSISDFSLTRLYSSLRIPSTDTITLAETSLTRMLSARRMATVTTYDDFEAGTYSFTEGGNSPNGKWTNLFLGGTGATSGVRFASSRGNNVMWQKPQVATSAGVTHATFNMTPGEYYNFDLTFYQKTVAQLRTGSAPNVWECAWVMFRYTDHEHLYYLVLKTNGVEFGRRDYSSPTENQIFLVTTGSPTLTIGNWDKVRIRAILNRFTCWINDTQVFDFLDDGSIGYDGENGGALPAPPSATMYHGKVGLYNEDAEVEFDDVWIGETDMISLSETITPLKTVGGVQYTRTPSAETTTVTDGSLSRLQSSLRLPSTEIVSIIDASLTKMLSFLRTPNSDTTTVVDASLTTLKQVGRVPSPDSTTVVDFSLNRLLSATRTPAQDTLSVSDSSLTRLLQLIRIPNAETIGLNENVSTTTSGRVNRSVSDTVNIVEQSLNRLLSATRIVPQDTSNVNEQLQRIKTLPRTSGIDSSFVSDASLIRTVSLSRSVSADTSAIVETALSRLLSALRTNTDNIPISEINAAVSFARSLTETLNITEPVLERIVTSVRLLTDDVEIGEALFYQTYHRFLIDSVIIAESLFKERLSLSGPTTYAIPDEVRPLLGNLGDQRTDEQINLAVDAAYDEINTKTNRIPPNDWKDTDHNFGIVKKLARLIAVKEMAIGIKDFDIKVVQEQIDACWTQLIEYDTTSGAVQDIVVSSEDYSYALNEQGIIWSTRYPNLKKKGSSEGDYTINTDT